LLQAAHLARAAVVGLLRLAHDARLAQTGAACIDVVALTSWHNVDGREMQRRTVGARLDDPIYHPSA